MMPAMNGKVRTYNLTTHGGPSGLTFTCEPDAGNPPLEATAPISAVVQTIGATIHVVALQDEAVILRLSALHTGGKVFPTMATSASVTHPMAVWAAEGSGCRSPGLECPVPPVDRTVPVEVRISAVATGAAPEISSGGLIPTPETRKGDCPVVIVYTPRLGD